MTELQKQVEQLELHGNDAELLSLLSCETLARSHFRRLALQFRLQAVELRYSVVVQVAA